MTKKQKRVLKRKVESFLRKVIVVLSALCTVLGFIIAIGSEDPIVHTSNFGMMFVGAAIMIIGILSLYSVTKDATISI